MRGQERKSGCFPASGKKMSGGTEKRGETSERLLDAIGSLPEEMVAEANDLEKIRQQFQKSRRRRIYQAGGGLAAAALLCFVVWGIHVGTGSSSREQKGSLAVQEKSGRPGSGFENREETGPSQPGGNGRNNIILKPLEAEGRFGVCFLPPGADNATGNGGVKTGTKEKGEKKTSKSAADRTGIIRESNDLSLDSEEAGEDGTILLQTEFLQKGGKSVQQCLMKLGETEDRRTYTLSASGGVSFLSAVPPDKKKGKTKNIKERKKYKCVSGTKIKFSLASSGNGDAESAGAVPDEWADRGIQAVGHIHIRVQEGQQTEKCASACIGKREGEYYAAFLEQRRDLQ